MATAGTGQRRRLTREELEELLEPSATTSERVRGLLEIGLHATELAQVTTVSVSTLRNWSAGQAEPRLDAAITLDDLRATVKILLDGPMEPQRIAHWLRGWNPKVQARPLELLASTPMQVRAAAHGEFQLV